MVIDFSAIDFREKPVLVLRNLDGTPLQTLGYAYNLNAEICYNEVSTITFDLPEKVDGVKTPHYDDVIGTRIVDMVGWGQFVLADPSEEKDGVKTVKSCKAYSLEYELTYKQMSLEENTYNFWNPVAPDETVIGIILSYLPSWSVGSIDSALVGKYRTFSESNVNIYNFIKSTVQDKYGCIFDFDTYNRRINVRATSSGAIMEPVYLSLENLAKKITLEEDTENIFTVLDVNGADGVTIRSVNPMGVNKIYDLSYFMNTGHFSQGMIDKWNAWKQTYEDAQVPYYNLTVEKMLKTMEILNLENKIGETLGTELAVLQNQQAVKAEYLASLSKSSAQYNTTKAELAAINSQITAKQSEIASANGQLSQLNAEKDDLTDELVTINEDVAFESFFTDEEMLILDRYFKEDAIEDSSFVYQTVEAYADDDVSGSVVGGISDPVIESAVVDAYEVIDGTLKNEDRFTFAVGKGYDTTATQSGNGYSSSSGTTATIKYTFDLSDVPDNATITSVRCRIQGRAESSSNANEHLDCQLYCGDAPKGSMSTFKSTGTTVTVLDLTAGTWTRPELDDLWLNVLVGYYGGAINGATVDVTYTVPTGGSVVITNAEVTSASGYDDRAVYSVRGGSLVSGDVSASVISASMERKSDDGSFIFTGYLGSGTIGTMRFMSGCISLAGTCSAAIGTDTGLSFVVTSAHLYFTKNVTAYQEHTVEWDLYNYGKECLHKLCYPSYTFDVTAANFFSLDDFASFAGAVELGQKIYLDTDDAVLNPILVKVGIDFENPASLSLQFGDKYSLSDSSFNLVDLLEQSVSMGKTVDTSRFGYNAFLDSGASTAVKDYMTGALDASKQAILSGSDIAVTFDGSGFHARKLNSSGTGYEPEEMAIINNNIVFTKDNWETAEMAIGHFYDQNLGDSWGIVAPNIVGTLLAGENLVIESTKQDGGVSVFKVDADGALLHNARFDIENQNGHIVLDPELGLGVGQYPIIKTENGQEVWDEDKANFWVDMSDGSVHLRGTLEGCDGTFSGSLSAATGSFSGEITGGSIKIGGTSSNPNFYVDSNGNLTAKSGTFSGTIYGNKLVDSNGNDMMANGKFGSDYLNLKGLTVTNTSGQTTFSIDSNGNVTVNGDVTLGSGSTISWNNVTNKPTDLVYEDDLSDVATSGSYNDLRNKPDIPELPDYITSTAITETTIISPHIKGNDVTIAPNDGYSSSYVGGLTIEGKYGNSLYDILHIYYYNSGDHGPVAAFENDWPIRFYDDVMFTGDVDFSEATVTGLSSATAVFG